VDGLQDFEASPFSILVVSNGQAVLNPALVTVQGGFGGFVVRDTLAENITLSLLDTSGSLPYDASSTFHVTIEAAQTIQIIASSAPPASVVVGQSVNLSLIAVDQFQNQVKKDTTALTFTSNSSTLAGLGTFKLVGGARTISFSTTVTGSVSISITGSTLVRDSSYAVTFRSGKLF
jgi:hypothetical protein